MRENMLITIGVFFGGRSVEHEVSVISAIQAIQNINQEKYNIVPIYITKEGKWVSGDHLLDIENYKQLEQLKKQASSVYFTPHFDDDFLYFSDPKKTAININVAFPILHGTYGEDGALQGLFELKGLPYIGCDVLSSAVGMDKVMMKMVLRDAGIPIVDFHWFFDKDWYSDEEKHLAIMESQLGYPVIVKPSNLGSSIGISKATNKEELLNAIDYALRFSQKVLVEKAISPLKEINCSVVGDYENIETSVLEEPLTTGDLLSFEDKYMSGGGESKSGAKNSGMSSLQRKIPAILPAEMEKGIRETAIKTFKTLGCGGVSRIDYLLDEENDSFYVNEINTIPGSLSFYLWEPKGKKYSELLEELIAISLKKDREKNNLLVSHNTNLFNVASLGGSKKMGTKV